ncbi:hypothetical protein [Actinoallomurus acaciae]|uniref:Uncharacterized protein n=1 Tax=Actinoallomurus acaciae TaxID=502577 RepID=A0ABV5YXJ7_9ACTN
MTKPRCRLRARDDRQPNGLAICPALERVLELSNRGPLVLLTGFQTPAGAGPARAALALARFSDNPSTI